MLSHTAIAIPVRAIRTAIGGPCRFARDRGGVSAVEFALIAPLVLFIMFASIAYGLIFSLHLSLQHLVAETGRSTIAGIEAGERRLLAREYFEANLDAFPFIDAEAAELEVADDGRFTEVRITYSIEQHPAYVFEGLIPLPEGPFVYRQIIRNGGG